MPTTLTSGGDGGSASPGSIQKAVKSALDSQQNQGAKGGGPSSGGQAAKLTVAQIQKQVEAALTPGWVILAIGAAGYLLSETRVVGPMFTVLLAVATIFQLTRYVNARSQGA